MNGDLIVGIGSPHGDDAVGWRAIERLGRIVAPAVRKVALREPMDLPLHLDGCRRLWIVDACRSGRPLGSVQRLSWPDQRIEYVGASSSHGLGIDAALRLVEALGRLPERVVIFAVEAANAAPGDGVSAEVEAALSVVEQRLVAELSRESLVLEAGK